MTVCSRVSFTDDCDVEDLFFSSDPALKSANQAVYLRWMINRQLPSFEEVERKGATERRRTPPSQNWVIEKWRTQKPVTPLPHDLHKIMRLPLAFVISLVTAKCDVVFKRI